MPQTIAYGQQQPRRRLMKWLVIALVVCVGLFSFRTAIDAAKWARLRWEWERCDIKPDTVVLDAAPAQYDGKLRMQLPLKGFIPPARLTFPQVPNSPMVGTALLHAMKSPAGHTRVVCIDLTGFDLVESGPPVRVICINWGVHESDRHTIHNIQTAAFWIDIPVDSRFRLFAASRDANDSSHFQMKYEYQGTSGVINGYLMDDDSVSIIPDAGTGGGPNPHDPWRPPLQR